MPITTIVTVLPIYLEHYAHTLQVTIVKQNFSLRFEFIAAMTAALLILMFSWSTIVSNGQSRNNSVASTSPLRPKYKNNSYVANTAFHQQIDHFSDDRRGMSPRSWSQIGNGDFGPPSESTFSDFGYESNQQIAPARIAPAPNNPAPSAPLRVAQMEPPQSFSQIGNTQVGEQVELLSEQPLRQKFKNASARLTPPRLTLQDQNTDASTADSVIDEARSIVEKSGSSEIPPSESERESQYLDSDNFQQDYDSLITENGSGFHGTQYGNEYFDEYNNGPTQSLTPYQTGQPCGCPQCQSNAAPQFEVLTCQQCGKAKQTPKGCFGRRKNRRQQSEMIPSGSDSMNSGCMDCDCPVCCDSKYAPQLGHRSESPIERGFNGSSSEKFSFEEDGDFPPINEILAQSVFFSELEYLFLQPSFQGNTALSIANGNSISNTPFNFDLQSGFRVLGGFESEFGPGFAGEYFQFDNNSDQVTFLSDGISTGTTQVFQLGTGAASSIVASNAGEAINTFQSLEVHSTSVYAFKAIQFKRASVNGKFGIRVVNVDQNLQANLTDASGQIGSLNHESHLSAFGPRFGIDYVRKIGHTPAQLISSASSSLLFGDREQIVENTITGINSTIGADEFVAVFDIFFGVQTKRIRGEKRNITTRIGFVNQTWVNGGTAINPNADFGFQGISFMLGFNR